MKRRISIDKDWKFHQLVNKVFDELKVKPSEIDDNNPIAGSLKRIYGNLKGMSSTILVDDS